MAFSYFVVRMHRTIAQSVRQFLLLTAWLLCACTAFAQIDTASINTPGLSRKTTRNPTLLVAELTAGKTTDLEKFEAIFTWVATNIHYDYKQYFSGEGVSTETDILRVLKRRRAICYQYAELMNFLCAKADIHSVTVTGYAKDRLFDINDTIYFDNHAWNAVKLDDKWHLYDVTWAAGGYVYRPTRFTKLILKWQERIITKRTRELKRKLVIKQPANEYCNIPKRKEVKRYTVAGLPWFWRIINGGLNRLPKRYKIDHGKLTDKNYFLTDPRLFAITHFPNVPYWSLTSEISSVRDYSADSAYYDLEPGQLLMNDLEGVDCRECDDFFALSTIDQQKESIRYALANNHRNGLEPANGYFRMATSFFKEAEMETDSLERTIAYDSTLYCLGEAKSLLNSSRKELTGYHRFHFAKEREKLQLVRKNNLLHLAQNVENVQQMRSRSNRMRAMGKKIVAAQRSYKRTITTYERFRTKTPAPKPMREESAAIQQEKADAIEATIDSLNVRLMELETDFNDRLLRLSDDVWKQNKLLFPQSNYFYQSAYERIMNSQDDRDKKIRLLQDTILKLEQRTRDSILQRVLLPSDTLFLVFKDLTTTARLRNNEQLKAMKVYGKLYIGRFLSNEELEKNRARFIDSTKRVYCYFYDKGIPLILFRNGYTLFSDSHYELYRAIKMDTKAEVKRVKSFQKEVLLNKKRLRKVSTHNLKYEAGFRKGVKAAKKAWLERLKKEREKAD